MNTNQSSAKTMKNWATGILIALVVLYFFLVILINRYDFKFLYYIKAFAEAGMVGALADWYAVTALLKKPLGVNIPHTNIIENNKSSIGENLGKFVSNIVEKAQSEQTSDKDFFSQIENFAGKSLNWGKKQVLNMILRKISSMIQEMKPGVLSNEIDKLVGKDLQFIRLSGTLVGGAVGVLIHAITQGIIYFMSH